MNYQAGQIPTVVPFGATTAPLDSALKAKFSGVGGVVTIAGSLAATYHGYKRNNSVAWALVWGLLGGVSPLVTNVIAVAQGYGKSKGAK